MTDRIRAWAAAAPKTALTAIDYASAALGDEEVDIAVSHCGICHSDLSMLDNDWGNARYPLVAGHEAIGTIISLGTHAKGLRVGQRVGLGWMAASCMHCNQCMSGHHNLCRTGEETIIGRHGGFAERVRCHWSWAIALPDALDPASSGPLFCGGLTVFSPIVEFGIRPTDRVGVVGIGGLGHLAVKFLHAWGCDVTAFTSSAGKAEEARGFGAHHVVATGDKKTLKMLAGSLDFILVTVNVSLDWNALLAALAPMGRLHFVGAVLEPIPVPAFALIGGRKSVSGSPLGSPATAAMMLDFCARHDISPQVEMFPMSRINDAIAHLRAGKARYRVVVENDFR
ncbi:MAG: NAD(P)-dependent alcohol dehydrogenase [Rudaea sp.]|nr:NAD(P)-dependent alcohol dehydrogenase [Rudaea sp.]